MSIYGKAILESTQVLNEGKIRDIINKFKKKREEKLNKTDKNLKPRIITEEEEKEIREEYKLICDKIKKLVQKYNNDPSTKKYIREEIDKEIENGNGEYMDGFDKKSGVPKLKFSIFEDLAKCKYREKEYFEAIVELYDGDQEVRVILNDVIYDIADELNHDNEIKLCTFSSGDGDEGCLYLSF